MTLVLDSRARLTATLERLLNGDALGSEAAENALTDLLASGTPPTLQAALLTALRAKGETPAELAGFARGMLQRARLVSRAPERVCVDTCGTGGDGTQSFNLSTATALLVAALGVPVAKHGNRAVSSRCGSADLIEALGLALPSEPDAAAAELARQGFVFLFAPHFHPALASLGALRRELGVRTIFNLLGPLLNPARPSHQLIGAARAPLAAQLAQAAHALGIPRAFVVHGEGFDEATPCTPFLLFAVTPAGVREERLTPEDFGLQRARPADLAGGDARENAARTVSLFDGREHGPLRDALCLNAALVLLLVELEREPRAALRAAAAALDDGRATRFLAQLRRGGGA
ncbi:MAG: anthranilate phosphoribosyltransferase [Planctomycetes bacterium]|nr:anthranilate phosphoribosyltransferase [Planctomycetota bacterium]